MFVNSSGIVNGFAFLYFNCYQVLKDITSNIWENMIDSRFENCSCLKKWNIYIYIYMLTLSEIIIVINFGIHTIADLFEKYTCSHVWNIITHNFDIYKF